MNDVLSALIKRDVVMACYDLTMVTECNVDQCWRWQINDRN